MVDPDVDLHDPAQLVETAAREWDLVAATSVGGVLGSVARYGLAVGVPHGTSAFPWSTLIINVSGCLLIGALMMVLSELTESPHRLIRPFAGVGILGGYTTYSTFALDVRQLLAADRVATVAIYLTATVIGGAVAVWVGWALTGRLGSSWLAGGDAVAAEVAR
ncbi:MAG: CrcB family protein [Actinobacteria bacterium]|nr:CrcB family protein [Actinomycetota bacterium]